VDLHVALIASTNFPSELPDKTMFASLVMAPRRPLQVWLGAAAPSWCTLSSHLCWRRPLRRPSHRAVDAVSPACSRSVPLRWLEATNQKMKDPAQVPGTVRTYAFVIIFLASGRPHAGLTANLAQVPLAPIGRSGSLLALWSVAAIAVVSGQALLRFVNGRPCARSLPSSSLARATRLSGAR